MLGHVEDTSNVLMFYQVILESKSFMVLGDESFRSLPEYPTIEPKNENDNVIRKLRLHSKMKRLKHKQEETIGFSLWATKLE